MEPACKKQKLERDILAEFTLGKNLKCSVEAGDYDGSIIRLMRGKRWITFSHK